MKCGCLGSSFCFVDGGTGDNILAGGLIHEAFRGNNPDIAGRHFLFR